ncbi:hypothetical protein [Sphingomonas sp. M1-B02]|uniref:hypothetical protein n=1 Tax=Sphingomonas sp. M1-B02 TaxID=3114300 RepID=UPI00223EA0FB|nr:hypothetical protein [Sphingomonas sp. S6-11]UZK66674.1 hypothetical protein OKW87_02210 [Sphingomonas sp. S6-11]
MFAINVRLAGIAAAGFAACVATPASAGTGCNGVVNIFLWGCAPWDNNNGPQYPYYRKKVITLPRQGTQIVTKNGVQMALRNGTYYPLIGTDGASMIGNDAGSFRVWTQ